jgi:glycosyltransferase involved in cell wall biosynthesis
VLVVVLSVSPLTRRRGVADLEAAYRLPTVSVVIPALNEARNLKHVFARMPADVYEIILVDGHSTDETVAIARQLRPDIRIVAQNRRGKGNALMCGFAECTGDIIVMIDADGSTDPDEIPAFVAALAAGADFAKGSRFTFGGHSHDITSLRKIGNRALNGLVNLLFKTRFTDLCYGYNAFWASCVPSFELAVGEPGEQVWGDGFEIETILNVRAARSGARIVEVASVEHARIHGESNLRIFRDGLRVLRTINRERRRSSSPHRVAVPEQRRVIELPTLAVDATAS